MSADETLHTVNVNKVAKNVLSIGLFGLFQVEDINLVATRWFMLSVTEEQFWKIQCKLEARQKNTWLFKGKDEIQPCSGATTEEVFQMYCSLVYDQNIEQLERTSLIYDRIELFTDNSQYIGIQTKHLDMIDFMPVIKKSKERESVIVDDVHVFTIVSQDHTKSPYLRALNL